MMADAEDIERALLSAYLTDLATQQASTLSWMKFYYLPEEIDWQRLYGRLPVVVVWAVDPTITPMCMSGPLRTEDCTYRIRMCAVNKVVDASYNAHAPTIPDRRILSDYREDLDVLYGDNTLSLSADCYIESIRYGVPSIPGYVPDEMTWLNSVELTFAHRYFRQLS